MKTKMNQMQRKLNTLEMKTNTEAEAKSSLFGEFNNDKTPFAF